MSKQPENIVVIMADQLTALALNCYGNSDVISPNIDALANNGVLFKNAYSSSPLCTPARYAFMSGQHVSVCGGYDNAAYMPSTLPTFAHYMRLAGYRTCLAGKMHFVGADQLHGFEERVTTDVYPADFGWVPDWDQPNERIDLWYHNMSSVKQAGIAAITNQLTYDDEVGMQTQRAIYDHARSEDERPLCLVSSFIHPHDPYAARKKYWDLYEGRDIAMPTTKRKAPSDTDPHNLRLEKVIALDAVDVSDEDILRARRAYYANVSYVDEWVGRIRATLDECGLSDNTSILFVADHGDMLGEHGLWYKMSFREWSCRIPLILYRPGQQAPAVVEQPVAQIDVLPTLVDFAARATGQQPQSEIDPLHGLSLLPMCDLPDEPGNRYVVSEYLAEGTGSPMLMLLKTGYKYICCDTDPEQLFDLENDPTEENNLLGSGADISPELQRSIEDFRTAAAAHWDTHTLKQKIIVDQHRRRAVSSALRVGRYTAWDYDPRRDPAQEYTRSHMDLTRHDISSRYPRPPKFKPYWS